MSNRTVLSPKVIRADGGLNLGIGAGPGAPRIVLIGTAANGPVDVPIQITPATAIDIFGDPDEGTLVKAIFEAAAGAVPGTDLIIYAYRITGPSAAQASLILEESGETLDALTIMAKYPSAVGNTILITGFTDGTGFNVYDPKTGKSYFVPMNANDSTSNRTVAEVAEYINDHSVLSQFIEAAAEEQAARFEIPLIEQISDTVDLVILTDNADGTWTFTAAGHSYKVGMSIELAGFGTGPPDLTGYNETYKIVAVATNTITVPYPSGGFVAGTPAGTETIVSDGLIAGDDGVSWAKVTVGTTDYLTNIKLGLSLAAIWAQLLATNELDGSTKAGGVLAGYNIVDLDKAYIYSQSWAQEFALKNKNSVTLPFQPKNANIGSVINHYSILVPKVPASPEDATRSIFKYVPAAGRRSTLIWRVKNLESDAGVSGLTQAGKDIEFTTPGDLDPTDFGVFDDTITGGVVDAATFTVDVVNADDKGAINESNSVDQVPIVLERLLSGASIWETVPAAGVVSGTSTLTDNGDGTLTHMFKLAADAAVGTRFRVTCDTTAIILSEKTSLAAVQSDGTAYSYFISGNALTFGAHQPFDCIIRFATVNYLELGAGIQWYGATGEYDGAFTFDTGSRPLMGDSLGFQYTWVPPLPDLHDGTAHSLTGGSPGTNMTGYQQRLALQGAYSGLKLTSREFTIIAGTYIDDQIAAFHPNTGLPMTLIGQYHDDLIAHVEEISQYLGESWGIMDVTPLSGDVTSATLLTHVRNLVEANTDDSMRAANFLSAISSDRLIVVDLPTLFRHPTTGLPYVSGGAAALAGLAATKPTQLAIMNRKFAGSLGPAYDIGPYAEYMTRARLNTWMLRADGDIVISDHLTMAATTSDYQFLTTGQIVGDAVTAFRMPALAMYGRGMDLASRSAFETEAIASLGSMMKADPRLGIGPALLGFRFEMISTPQEAVQGLLRYTLYLTPTPIAREIEVEIVLRQPSATELGTTEIAGSIAD